MTTVSQSQLEGEIGRGGRGIVCRARDTLEYGAQITAAREAAHAAGINHRDIKPANIVIAAADGRANVLEFGLAKATERPSNDAANTGVGTAAGTILGTAAYMSPEQAQGHRLDARSDIFSIGAVLRGAASATRGDG